MIGLEPTIFCLTGSSYIPLKLHPNNCCSCRNWTYDLFLVRELFLTTELRSNEAVSLTSNYSKEGSSKSSTLWKHENIVWTLWDLNSSKTLQMSCANLITLQSPFKYGYLDSNQGQLAPKASILPTELHPYIVERWGPDPQAFYCSHCFQDKSQSHWVTSPLPTYLCRIGLQ